MNKCIKYVSILIMLIGFAATAAADPLTITSVSHTGLTHNSVTITWTTDEASDSLVKYMNASGMYESPKDSTEVYSHTIELTGLSPDMTYAYKVNSTNASSGNTSETAGGGSFTTASAPDTTPPVISIVADTAADNSATITWTTNEDSNSLVKYGTTSGTYLYNRSSVNMVKSHSINLTGLSANTTYYYVVNSTDGSGNSNEYLERDFTTDAESSSDITPPTISDVKNTTTSDTATITWTTNEDSDSLVKYDTNSDTPYEYNKSSDTLRQDHSIKLTGLEADTTYYFMVNSTDSSGNPEESGQFTFKTKSSGYTTGNRIWDEDEGMDPDYTWTASSFTGFYYDLDDDVDTETLTINDIGENGRTIDEDAITYETSVREVKFDYSTWDYYEVIGFMAEKYFAGYSENTSDEITKDDISLVSKDILSKILIDEDDDHTISTGASLELKEGYELKIVQLDVNGNQAQIELLRNGKRVDTDFVKSPATFVYRTDLGKVDDVPLIIVHVSSVFAGTETDMVEITGIFQISEDYTSVKTGDDYGEMEIAGATSTKITMRNRDDITLGRGDTIDLMGDVKIIVADNDTIRFALYEDITDPGTYDIRGTVMDTGGVDTWNHLNFEGFYYNIDDDLGTEKLVVEDDGDIVYTTETNLVEFDYSDWDEYKVIGFMAEQYFAGYDKYATNNVVADDDISLTSKEMLSKVLLDDDSDHTISTGASLQLEEGYELKIVQLDVNGNQAQIELLRNGKRVDTDFVKSPATFVYRTDLGKLDDVPLIIVHINSVFSGTETDMVEVTGIFQISENYKSVKDGDDYGEMEVKNPSKNKITMRNRNDVSLASGDTTMIMEDIGFKVSDDGDRYHLFVRRTIGSLDALAIDFSETPVVDEKITITVTSDGDPVEGAAVTFGGENLGLTDSNGEVTVTSEESGTYTVTAIKEDYQSATEDLKILTEGEAQEDQLAIEMPGEVNPGDDVIIKVTSDGDPVEGASVKWDSEDIGETDETGSLTYTADEPGTYTIVVNKSGYLDSSEKITVSIPSAKFKLSNFVFPEEVSAGEKFTVSVDVTNNGEVNGTYTAELSANGSVVESKDIKLDPDETGTVEFTHKIAEAGTYTIEIGTESGEIVVTKKTQSNTAAVAAILIVLAVLGAIGYVLISSAPEGGWTSEKLIEAIKEKFQRKGL